LFIASAISYLLARRYQPGSAYTFVFPMTGLAIRPGTRVVVSLKKGV